MTTDRVSGALSSLAIKAPCRVATTANITLNGLQTIDGVTVVQDDRVLVKHQTSSVNNGIYIADSGDWVRAPDFDGSYDVANGTLIQVNYGTAGLKTQWSLSATDPITIGTTSISFVTSLSTTVGALELAYRRNAFYNGDFQVWQKGTGATSSSAGSRTFLADRWFVNPAGAAVNQQQSTSVPTSSRARFSLEIQGATSVTTVNIGQRLSAADIPKIKRTVTFQCYVRNVSGLGDFTPSLLLGTPTIADDFGTVTNRLTQTLQSCTDSAWTQVSHTVDISGYTDIDNGLQAELRIPSGFLISGCVVRLTEMQLAPCAAVTAFDGVTYAEELERDKFYFRKSFPYATAPAQNAGVSGALQWINILSGAVAGGPQSIEIDMRATPTVTLYNPSATNAQIRNTTTAADFTGSSVVSSSDKHIRISGTQDAGATAGAHVMAVHWTADAEL